MKIRTIIAIIIFIGIGGYASFESRNLIMGPVITIEAPATGSTSNSPITNIKGHGRNIAHISLNDRPISTDELGNFEEKYVLSVGNNIVKVSAKDRFGRKNDVLVEIIYNEPGESFVLGTTPSHQ